MKDRADTEDYYFVRANINRYLPSTGTYQYMVNVDLKEVMKANVNLGEGFVYEMLEEDRMVR